MDASHDLEANPDSAGGVVVMTWGFLAALLRFVMMTRYDQTCGVRRSADFAQVTSASAESQNLTSTGLPHRESRLMLRRLRDWGVASRAAAVLGDRAARTGSLDRAHEVAELLDRLREEGAEDALAAMAKRIANNIPLSDPYDLYVVLDSFQKTGQKEAVEALLARDPASAVTFDHPARLSYFINWLFQAKKHQALARLLARDPARSVPISDPSAVALLLQRLRHAGESEALAALLARDPASAVALDHPDRVAQLVEVLRTMDPQNGLPKLIARDPAGSVVLKNRDGVSWLMKALMKAGAHQSAAALAIRAADSGMFTLLLKIRSYPYGREPDGSPSPQWGWMDLGKPGRDWRP